MGLRARLTILLLLAVIPALGVTVYTFVQGRAEAAAHAYDSALRLARQVAESENQLIGGGEDLLSAMAQHAQVRAKDAAGCRSLVANLLGPLFINLGAAGVDGTVFCSARTAPRGVSIAEPSFLRAATGRRFSVSVFQIDHLTGQPAILLASPLRNAADSVVGTVFAVVDLSQLRDAAKQVPRPPDTTLAVVDRDGTVLARDPESATPLPRPLHSRTVLTDAQRNNGTGVTRERGPDGVERLFGIAVLPVTSTSGPVFVIVGVPAESVFGPIDRAFWRSLISLGLAGFLLLVIVSVSGSYLIVRPVNSIVVAARRLATGDLGARTGVRHGPGELNQLAEAFDDMADSLQQREAQLERTAAELRASIAERARAEDRVRQQVAQLASLRTIDQAITSSLDLRVTLSLLLEHTVQQLDVAAAAVLLLNPVTQVLEFAAGRGFRSRVLENQHVALGKSFAGVAAVERRRVHIPDMRGSANELPALLAAGGEPLIGYLGIPLIVKGRVKGVLEVFSRDVLTTTDEWLQFSDALAGEAAIAIDNAALFDGLHRANTELILAYDTTLEVWARAVERRGHRPEGQTEREAELAVDLAVDLGVPPEDLANIRRGALLHDIGMMAVPESIILKTGPLTPEEWEAMRAHPTFAYELLNPIPYLRAALDIPYAHHERWDGTGYPRGLQGEGIPLTARMFAVADVWMAVTSDRPFRPAWPYEQALDYLRQQSGRHFEPAIVEAFIRLEESRLPASSRAGS